MTKNAPGARLCAIGRYALLAGVMLVAFPAGPLTAMQNDSVHVRARGRAAARTASPAPVRLQWLVGAGSSYDTNLQRRHDGLDSFGFTGTLGATLRATLPRTSWALEYEYALHRFELSEEWNRASHVARAAATVRLASSLIIGATAELTTGSASEDREIGTQRSLLPRIELRPDARNRLRLLAGVRERRFGDLSGSNARNTLIGLDYRIGESRRPTVMVGTRHDRNETDDARSRFQRWAHTVRFTAPVAGASELALELRQSTRTYPDRFLDLESIDALDDSGRDWLARYADADPDPRPAPGIPGPDGAFQQFPRRDEIWSPAMAFTHRTRAGLEISFAYVFETRLSNDLRRGYSGHTATLTSRFRR